MEKFLSILVSIFVTQLIVIMMWAEYIWSYRVANGGVGVGGTPINQVPALIWFILFIEAIIFSYVIVNYKNKS